MARLFTSLFSPTIFFVLIDFQLNSFFKRLFVLSSELKLMELHGFELHFVIITLHLVIIKDNY